MSRSLSADSSIDALRREAKRWLKSITGGDPEAVARFGRAFPHHKGVPKLREAQQALAREYGFPSWAALKQELEDRARRASRPRLEHPNWREELLQREESWRRQRDEAASIPDETLREKTVANYQQLIEFVQRQREGYRLAEEAIRIPDDVAHKKAIADLEPVARQMYLEGLQLEQEQMRLQDEVERKKASADLDVVARRQEALQHQLLQLIDQRQQDDLRQELMRLQDGAVFKKASADHAAAVRQLALEKKRPPTVEAGWRLQKLREDAERTPDEAVRKRMLADVDADDRHLGIELARQHLDWLRRECDLTASAPSDPAHTPDEAARRKADVERAVAQFEIEIESTQRSLEQRRLEDEAARRRAEQQRPRTPVPFDPKQFDKYVGFYQMGPNDFLTISRRGEQFFATAEREYELSPESPTKFFATVGPGQISFITDAHGNATELVVHAGGIERRVRKVDESVVKAAAAALAERIRNKTPSTGTEAALRRFIEAFQKGQPNYEDMTPEMALDVRRDLSRSLEQFKKMGALKSLTFIGVNENGMDIYTVVCEHSRGDLPFAPLTPDGKMGPRAIEWLREEFGRVRQ